MCIRVYERLLFRAFLIKTIKFNFSGLRRRHEKREREKDRLIDGIGMRQTHHSSHSYKSIKKRRKKIVDAIKVINKYTTPMLYVYITKVSATDRVERYNMVTR